MHQPDPDTAAGPHSGVEPAHRSQAKNSFHAVFMNTEQRWPANPCLGNIRERPMTKITLEQKWRQLSEAAKKEAEKLPYGEEREALLRKARKLETASQIDQWISSPALQPPT